MVGLDSSQEMSVPTSDLSCIVRVLLLVLGLASVCLGHGFPPPAPPPPPGPVPVVPQIPTGCSLPGNVLILDDHAGFGGTGTQSHAGLAAADLGLSPVVVTDWRDLELQLTSGVRWDLVVVLDMYADLWLAPSQLDELERYLNGSSVGSPNESHLIFYSSQLFVGIWMRVHPLFAAMGVTPASPYTQDLNLLNLVPEHALMGGIPPRFALEGVVPAASPYCTATPIFGQSFSLVVPDHSSPGAPPLVAGAASATVSTDGRAMWLGVSPMTLAPTPDAGRTWMRSLISHHVGAENLSVADVRLPLGATVPVGGPIDLEVDVESTFPVAASILVEVFAGPLEDQPELQGGVPTLQTRILVLGGGRGTAFFQGLTAPLVADCWRVHVRINSDQTLTECGIYDNFESGGLCVVPTPPPCPDTCGDCDADGQVGTIIDALYAAQIAGGITGAGLACACDVDQSETVTVLDSLLLAQVSAGIQAITGCGSSPSLPFINGEAPDLSTGKVTWTIDTCAPAPHDMTFEFTTDGGITWSAARAHSQSPCAQAALAIPTALDIQFIWDSDQDISLASRPANAALRCTLRDTLTGALDTLVSSSFTVP